MQQLTFSMSLNKDSNPRTCPFHRGMRGGHVYNKERGFHANRCFRFSKKRYVTTLIIVICYVICSRSYSIQVDNSILRNIRNV